jgi:hypothetical protein
MAPRVQHRGITRVLGCENRSHACVSDQYLSVLDVQLSAFLTLEYPLKLQEPAQHRCGSVIHPNASDLGFMLDELWRKDVWSPGPSGIVELKMEESPAKPEDLKTGITIVLNAVKHLRRQ